MTQPVKEDSKLADSKDNPQIGERSSSVTAVTEAPALNATFDDVEVEAAIAVNAVAINLVISALEAHGLIADN